MKAVVNLMVKDFKIDELGYDFMGYSLNKGDCYSFHHLIVPKRDCFYKGIEDNGYVKWNGAILCHNSSHQYLHLIEQRDRRTFTKITNIMIDMNVNDELDIERLRQIDELLQAFERKHKNDRNKTGAKLLKKEYLKRNHF